RGLAQVERRPVAPAAGRRSGSPCGRPARENRKSMSAPSESASAKAAVPAPGAPTAGIELDIGGMTCASCGMRIEKKLGKLDGVEASVNYATEKAKVTTPEGYDPAELVRVVEQTGYTAQVHRPSAASAPEP